MLNKFQFFKRLATSRPTAVVHQPSLFFIKPNQIFHTPKTLNQPSKSNYSTISYQDDFYLLTNYSREQLVYAKQLMDEFAKCEDVTLLHADDVEEISSVLTSFIMAHRIEGNYDKSFRYMLQLEDLQKKRGIKDTIDVAQCQHSLACEYIDRQDFYKAKAYLESAVRICKALEDNEQTFDVMVQSLHQLAYVYAKTYQNEKALEVLNVILARANEIAEDIKPKILQEVSELMQHISQLEEKTQENLEKFQDLSDLGKAQVYLRQVDQFRAQGNLKECQIYLRKALDIFESQEPLNYLQIADLYGVMGQISFKQGDWSSALESFKKRERYLDKFNATPSDVQLTYRYLSAVYQGLRNYDESLKYCQKIIQSAQTTGETWYLGTAYSEIGRVYEAQGMLKLALEAYIQAEKYGDKEDTTGKASSNKIAEIQNKLK